MNINKKNNLLRYLAGMGVVISLLLFAGTCEVKSNGGPPGGTDTTCKEGFKIELADAKYGKAFEVGKFESQDVETGAFLTNVTVKLSALTYANGFVSNHAWLHPDKVNPRAYDDKGEHVLGKVPNFIDFLAIDKAVTQPDMLDHKWCAGAADNLILTGLVPDLPLADSFVNSTGHVKDAQSEASARGAITGDVGGVCEDIDVGGVFISKNGTVKGMNVWKADPSGISAGTQDTDSYAAVDVNVETDEEAVKKTGIYYLRDNISAQYDVTDGGNAMKDTADGKLFFSNDTNFLYQEYERIFADGGAAPAAPDAVFPADKNVINPHFTGQNWNATAGTGKSLITAPTIGTLGGNTGEGAGGWQKLFTLKSCDEKMKNGFAIAKNLSSATTLSGFKTVPDIAYKTPATLPATDAGTFLRVGKEAGGSNDKAILVDSILGGNFITPEETSLFTVRHDANTANLGAGLNAITTKGEVVCRSAFEVEAADTAKNLMDENADTSTVAEKITGYVDGEIKSDNEGIGLTCYLGLTALWPEAVDAAPALVTIHDAQFAGKAVANRYDVADKNIGVVMVHVDKDTPLSDPLIKPIFIDRLGSTAVAGGGRVLGELNTTDSAVAMGAIKAAASDKVKYVHGVMTLKFVK